MLAAVDEGDARVKNAARSAAEGEAQFALGLVQVEATDILNRDLAAHSGRLTVQRRTSAEGARPAEPGAALRRGHRAVPLAKDPARGCAAPLTRSAVCAARAFCAPQGGLLRELRARSLRARWHELRRARSPDRRGQALAPALLSSDDAEEAAFIHAVDLARAARLAREPRQRAHIPAKRAWRLRRSPRPTPTACARLRPPACPQGHRRRASDQRP